ncbi:MAG: polysaccharide biosynthesis/export family protein [Bacteroidetes bacterium]|nr:polysaccharide biosynthesis/export family protein [Bacteroidota bacterium]
MLKTPKDFDYDKLSDSLTKLNYRIEPTDEINYKIFSNDGFKLVDLSSGSNFIERNDLNLTVESDGTAKFPLIGRVKLAGLTKTEAETLLEEKYTEYYVKPYVLLKITNKRVTVFPGNGGMARVITLSNNNTTVIEALALAGGITDDGKAYKVKLIRNNGDKKPLVYLMDLSKIDGLSAGRSVVLANDIIYVEPRYRVAKTFATELTPVLTLLSTTLIIFTYIKNVK